MSPPLSSSSSHLTCNPSACPFVPPLSFCNIYVTILLWLGITLLLLVNVRAKVNDPLKTWIHLVSVPTNQSVQAEYLSLFHSSHLSHSSVFFLSCLSLSRSDILPTGLQHKTRPHMAASICFSIEPVHTEPTQYT